MNNCSHIKKDGSVCSRRCFREKCHYHTDDRMKHDSIKHQELRKKKISSAVKDGSTVFLGPSSFSSVTAQEKSDTLKDASHTSHASVTSHASHTEKEEKKIQASVTEQDKQKIALTKIISFVKALKQKINNLANVPKEYINKSNMELLLNFRLRNTINDLKLNTITPEKAIAIYYAEASKIIKKHNDILQF